MGSCSPTTRLPPSKRLLAHYLHFSGGRSLRSAACCNIFIGGQPPSFNEFKRRTLLSSGYDARSVSRGRPLVDGKQSLSDTSSGQQGARPMRCPWPCVTPRRSTQSHSRRSMFPGTIVGGGTSVRAQFTTGDVFAGRLRYVVSRRSVMRSTSLGTEHVRPGHETDGHKAVHAQRQRLACSQLDAPARCRRCPSS